MTVKRIVADLPGGDTAALSRFYADLLGMDLAMDMGWICTFVGSEQAPVQVSLMTSDATAPMAPALSVEVDDVDSIHARAMEMDLEIIHPLTDEPWGVRRFFVRDPAGNVINVLAHKQV